MRTSPNKAAHQAFTSKELIIVIATIALVATLVGVAMIQSHRIRLRNVCANNQKQIVLSFKMFAGDSAQIFPVEYFVQYAHKFPSNSNRAVWEYLCVNSNELGTAKILICPKDATRRTNVVQEFSNTINGLANPSRQNNSISYFLGMSAHETRPNTLALGDRNLAADERSAFYSSSGGESQDVSLQSTWRTFPAQPFHGDSGYFALSDGSVQQASTNRLREALFLARQSYGASANRFLFPQ